MINMLYVNLSFLFLYAKNKSKRTLNVTFLRQNCKNNRWCEHIFTTKCSRQILLKRYSYWLETFILLVAPKRAFFVSCSAGFFLFLWFFLDFPGFSAASCWCCDYCFGSPFKYKSLLWSTSKYNFCLWQVSDGLSIFVDPRHLPTIVELWFLSIIQQWENGCLRPRVNLYVW